MCIPDTLRSLASALFVVPLLALTAESSILQLDFAQRLEVSRLIDEASSGLHVPPSRMRFVPEVTAIAFDAAGLPQTQISVYCGNGFTLSDDRLTSYLKGFSLPEGDVDDESEFDGFRDLMVLPQAIRPTEPAAFTLIDLQEDVLIELRHVNRAPDMGVSCSASSVLKWSANFSAGTYLLPFGDLSYTQSDMIAVAAGPDRNSPANPDLYLDAWTGTAWDQVTYSKSTSQVDLVRGYISSCGSIYWRVRIVVAKSGPFSVRAVRFHAN